MPISIENENTLMRFFESGINLFIGSGFSVEAKDKKTTLCRLAINSSKKLFSISFSVIIVSYRSPTPNAMGLRVVFVGMKGLELTLREGAR